RRRAELRPGCGGLRHHPPGRARRLLADARTGDRVEGRAVTMMTPGAGEPMPERTPGGGERGVRPYLLTRGRTRSGELAGFETLVVMTELGRERITRMGPEH